MNSQRRAFNILEIFVVFIILGVLAAILFPILATPSKEKPLVLQCLSNTKQVGLSLAMYSQDYDDHFPPAEKWMTVLDPYTKNGALFVCPSVKKENPKAQASYAMDTRLSGAGLKKLAAPEKRALTYDSTRTDWNAADPGQTFAPRHTDKGNVTFADGHAKQVTPEQFRDAAR